MADRTIKPDSGNDLVLQNNGAGTKIEIPNSGDIEITGTIGSGTFNGTIGTSASGSANLPAVKTALNASGSAPIYACRAWVNFNGTGTVAIRASGNVSSITDNGGSGGDYTVNFTSAMPDANYCVSANAKVDIGVRTVVLQPTSGGFASGSIRVVAVLNSDVSVFDSDFCCVAVFR